MMKLNIQLFGHTNETTNYDLPQFVGTDKPTWLGDINTAMADIDTAIAANASNISSLSTRVSSAESTASQASTDVASLQSTVSSLSSSVSSATSTANNAQSTATSALNTANSADGKADTNATAISGLDTRVTACESDISNFNLTSFNLLPVSVKSGTFTLNNQNLYCATNSDGSLAKIYGIVTATNITADGVAKISTSLRPESDIRVVGGCIRIVYTGSSTLTIKNFGQLAFNIKTNGDVEFDIQNVASGDSVRLVFINSLIYVKDFGDSSSSGD